jgi:hypothetical protein
MEESKRYLLVLFIILGRHMKKYIYRRYFNKTNTCEYYTLFMIGGEKVNVGVCEEE